MCVCVRKHSYYLFPAILQDAIDYRSFLHNDEMLITCAIDISSHCSQARLIAVLFQKKIEKERERESENKKKKEKRLELYRETKRATNGERERKNILQC